MVELPWAGQDVNQWRQNTAQAILARAEAVVEEIGTAEARSWVRARAAGIADGHPWFALLYELADNRRNEAHQFAWALVGNIDRYPESYVLLQKALEHPDELALWKILEDVQAGRSDLEAATNATNGVLTSFRGQPTPAQIMSEEAGSRFARPGSPDLRTEDGLRQEIGWRAERLTTITERAGEFYDGLSGAERAEWRTESEKIQHERAWRDQRRRDPGNRYPYADHAQREWQEAVDVARNAAGISRAWREGSAAWTQVFEDETAKLGELAQAISALPGASELHEFYARSITAKTKTLSERMSACDARDLSSRTEAWQALQKAIAGGGDDWYLRTLVTFDEPDGPGSVETRQAWRDKQAELLGEIRTELEGAPDQARRSELELWGAVHERSIKLSDSVLEHTAVILAEKQPPRPGEQRAPGEVPRQVQVALAEWKHNKDAEAAHYWNARSGNEGPTGWYFASTQDQSTYVNNTRELMKSWLGHKDESIAVLEQQLAAIEREMEYYEYNLGLRDGDGQYDIDPALGRPKIDMRYAGQKDARLEMLQRQAPIARGIAAARQQMLERNEQVPHTPVTSLDAREKQWREQTAQDRAELAKAQAKAGGIDGMLGHLEKQASTKRHRWRPPGARRHHVPASSYPAPTTRGGHRPGA